MHEIPMKFSGIVFSFIASGTAAVVNEHTLVPLGIFATVSLTLIAAAWKVSHVVTLASAKLESVDRKLKSLEDRMTKLERGDT